MQFDRFLNKAVSRLSGGSDADDPRPVPRGAPADDLRGSGSWANEWGAAKGAIERAKSLAAGGKAPKRRSGVVAQNIPEGTVRTKPLMTTRDIKLHSWLQDRLEAEAPTCTIHAGVALNAFLVSAEANEEYDPLCNLTVDLLIADDQGQPLVALIHENRVDSHKQLLMLDALLDADMPIIDIQPRPVLSAMWAEIAANLPED
ncbi:hypothetical protein [Jannaschia sp. 2305UL9-9]|uniref:hypothetical protein n=1 Tax=Jannaschia sp. 2305UL9-9 TaxID=3121638 RepID=UPI003527A375